MDKSDLDKLPRKSLLPGYESGRYEPVREYDRSEFRKPPFEDPVRRDNRVSVRISGQDMGKLHKLALAEGVPLQSLIASIVHRYINATVVGQDPALPATPFSDDYPLSPVSPLLDTDSSPEQR